MYKWLFYIALFFPAAGTLAQDQLNPERPGETRTPELVKGNNLQAEVGFRKEREDPSHYMYQHPEALLRFGLFNALELRMELTSQTLKDNINKKTSSGIAPVYFGIKAKILPEYKWLPSIGALAQVGVPSLASGDFFVDGIPFEFRTLFNNNINDKFSLQYNAGVSWNETNKPRDNKQWMYTVAPVFKINDTWQVFVEEYAFLRNGAGAEHYFDGGIQYFFKKDFALDICAGVGLSEESSDYIIEGGLSYRLNFSKR